MWQVYTGLKKSIFTSFPPFSSTSSGTWVVFVLQWQHTFHLLPCQQYVCELKAHQAFIQMSQRSLKWSLIGCNLISLIFLSITRNLGLVTLGSVWKKQINILCFSPVTLISSFMAFHLTQGESQNTLQFSRLVHSLYVTNTSDLISCCLYTCLLYSRPPGFLVMSPSPTENSSLSIFILTVPSAWMGPPLGIHLTDPHSVFFTQTSAS